LEFVWVVILVAAYFDAGEGGIFQKILIVGVENQIISSINYGVDFSLGVFLEIVYDFMLHFCEVGLPMRDIIG
jgi:hypothetical protein